MLTRVTIVASPNRAPRFDAIGGIAARSTAPNTVHLIGTAATPLGGDEIHVSIRVEPGASLTVHSVAATVALPSVVTDLSHAEWHLDVGEGGSLVMDPQPVIVASTADHRSVTTVSMTTSSSLYLRERVQIGRSNESGGRWSGVLRVDVDGRPRVRHLLELGNGAHGHDILSAPAALESILSIPGPPGSGPRIDGAAIDGARVTLPLENGGALTTWTGPRLRIQQRRVHQLRA